MKIIKIKKIAMVVILLTGTGFAVPSQAGWWFGWTDFGPRHHHRHRRHCRRVITKRICRGGWRHRGRGHRHCYTVRRVRWVC